MTALLIHNSDKSLTMRLRAGQYPVYRIQSPRPGRSRDPTGSCAQSNLQTLSRLIEDRPGNPSPDTIGTDESRD